MKTKNKPKPRGFAAMDPERQREICSMGGKAIAKRKGWLSSIGRIGGLAKKTNGNNHRKTVRKARGNRV